MYYLVKVEHREDAKLMKIVDELSDVEFMHVLSIFDVNHSFKQIRQMYEITEEINTDLLDFLHFENLNKCLTDYSESAFKVMKTANKLILNYCTAIKLLIEKIEYFTRDNIERLEKFKTIFSSMYDNELSYRFLMRLRNYIIHNAMPFSTFTIGKKKTNVLLNKNELLKWGKWNKVKEDIEKMDEGINLYPIIEEMRSLMYTVYINVLDTYADDLFEAYTKHERLLEKYKADDLLFSSEPFQKNIDLKNLIVLPISSLKDSIKELEKVPNICITYK
ncbi:hypothetical protein [Enterococcus ureasiticus]|uniref:Uncharacterized protein n=1 Tax=Enterococcus ureasiticus TaxID=903984 RepID=A0A1E5GAC7_9ENTE|nr:hypothetical protein [Enterococcus ureasiticus]OEG09649.1 hypothetical protein BCR21_15010 [Enterococcus ureasiticus]